jgi:hypothetical protein
MGSLQHSLFHYEKQTLQTAQSVEHQDLSKEEPLSVFRNIHITLNSRWRKQLATREYILQVHAKKCCYSDNFQLLYNTAATGEGLSGGAISGDLGLFR